MVDMATAVTGGQRSEFRRLADRRSAPGIGTQIQIGFGNDSHTHPVAVQHRPCAGILTRCLVISDYRPRRKGLFDSS